MNVYDFFFWLQIFLTKNNNVRYISQRPLTKENKSKKKLVIWMKQLQNVLKFSIELLINDHSFNEIIFLHS